MTPDDAGGGTSRPPMAPTDVYLYAHGAGAITRVWPDGTVDGSITLREAWATIEATEEAGGGVWVAGEDAPLAIDTLRALGRPGIMLQAFAATAAPYGWVQAASPIMSAILDGRPDLVRDLIERHADVHQADYLGFTALHYAAAAGDVASIDALLEAGADVNAVSWVGDRPRDQALLWERDEAADRLLRAGADPELNSGPYAASPRRRQ